MKTSSRPPRVLLGNSSQKDAAPPTAPQAHSVIPITVGYRLHEEVIFLSTVMDSIFDPFSPVNSGLLTALDVVDAVDVLKRVVVEVEAQICQAGCRTAVP